MGFKADTSFLRFLTMGAVGARATIDQLRNDGFEPIELERYGTSNKIWTTKVKRLRLPDLLCVKTGLRIEVREEDDPIVQALLQITGDAPVPAAVLVRRMPRGLIVTPRGPVRGGAMPSTARACWT